VGELLELLQRAAAGLPGWLSTLAIVVGTLIALQLLLVLVVTLVPHSWRTTTLAIGTFENATGIAEFQTPGLRTSILAFLLGDETYAGSPGVEAFDPPPIEARADSSTTLLGEAIARAVRVVTRRSTLVLDGVSLSKGALHGLYVQVSDTRTRRVWSSHTFWAGSFDSLAEQAGAWAVWVVTNQAREIRQVPRWQRWTAANGYSYLLYRQALELSRRGMAEEATHRLDQCMTLEPSNVLPRLWKASLLEQQGRSFYGEAIYLYYLIIRLWPEVLEARYRLTTTSAASPSSSPTSSRTCGGHRRCRCTWRAACCFARSTCSDWRCCSTAARWSGSC